MFESQLAERVHRTTIVESNPNVKALIERLGNDNTKHMQTLEDLRQRSKESAGSS